MRLPSFDYPRLFRDVEFSPIVPTPKHTPLAQSTLVPSSQAMGYHNDNHKKLKANARKWAVLTMEIGKELNAPIEHKYRIHTSLMKLTDPKLYRVDSYTWKFMTRLRKELLRAYQNMTKQKAPTANPTTAIETPTTDTPPRPSNANNLEQAAIKVKRDEDCAHQEQQLEQKLQVQQVQQEPRPQHIQAMES